MTVEMSTLTINDTTFEIVDKTAREEILDIKANATQQTPLFANSIDELEESGDTSKVYVLPDGYIYAFMKGEGEAELVDLMSSAVGKDNTVMKNASGEAVGYADGYYLTGNADNPFHNAVFLASDSTHFTTGSMPYTREQAEACTPIYIQGVTLDLAQSHTRLGLYPSYNHNIYTDVMKGNQWSTYMTVEELDNGMYKLTPKNTFAEFFLSTGSVGLSDINYMRFSLKGSGAGVKIGTELTAGEDVYSWQSTGHKFVPADYEDRILALERAFVGDLAVYGIVTDENDIILSGLLESGTYTFKYQNADGTTDVIGTKEV